MPEMGLGSDVAPRWYPLTKSLRENGSGGEGGIRTLDPGCPGCQISNLVPSTTRPPLRSAKPSTYAVAALTATSQGCDSKSVQNLPRACRFSVCRALWRCGANLIYQAAPHLVQPRPRWLCDDR